jgi:3-oxoacyl-[acyl-carrier protein] reductase
MHDNLLKSFGLAGRVAVVTGGASGIGGETALVLAEAGARVVAADVDQEGLQDTLRALEGLGAEGRVRRTDVSQRADLAALAEDTLRWFGQLDVWVNCAAIIVRGPVLQATEEDFDAQVAVNLKGVYFGCAAAGQAMEPRRSGSIVNISSGGGDRASPGISVYSATKAGVNAVTRACAVEFGAFGVRVNSIAPGFIDTPMTSVARETDPARRAAYLDGMAKASPLDIIGAPRDIALAVLYLASDASRFVTGQVLRANGGVFML